LYKKDDPSFLWKTPPWPKKNRFKALHPTLSQKKGKRENEDDSTQFIAGSKKKLIVSLGRTMGWVGVKENLLLVLEGISGTLLGETLVADELGADTLEVGVALGLHLLDTITVSLLVYYAIRD